MAYIDNHVERGLDRLLEQYKGRLKIRSLFTSFLSRYQLLENVLADIDYKARLEHAEGVVLDRWGVNFAVARNELSDDEYRQEIFARIIINNSKGTIEDILMAINLLYKPDAVRLIEYDCLIQINCVNPIYLQNIHKMLPVVIASGVKYCVTDISDNAFIFSECSSEVVDFVGKEEEEIEIDVSTDNSSQIFEVESDTILLSKRTFGFAEIIVTKANLNIGSEDIYLVEEFNPLDILLTYDDFIIQGGSKLAEVIENGR